MVALRQLLLGAPVSFVWSGSGQGLASPLLVAGEHAAQGGSLPSGVPLCLDGAGVTQSLRKLIRDGAGLGCPLQMPKRERGREDRYRDVVRVVPRLPTSPRDAQRGCVRPKASSGGCLGTRGWGWQELLGRASRSPHGTAKCLRKRHRGGFEAPSRAKYRAAPTNGGAGILIFFSRESASPRGGGPGTNKRRWLSPSRRRPGASPARRHSPGGFAFISRPGDLLGVGRDQRSGCPAPRTTVAPWDAPGDETPGYPPGTQPPRFASTGYAVH